MFLDHVVSQPSIPLQMYIRFLITTLSPSRFPFHLTIPAEATRRGIISPLKGPCLCGKHRVLRILPDQRPQEFLESIQLCAVEHEDIQQVASGVVRVIVLRWGVGVPVPHGELQLPAFLDTEISISTLPGFSTVKLEKASALTDTHDKPFAWGQVV